MSATGVRLSLVEPDNLEARVSALEGQVRELGNRVLASEHDAAAARVLAGAADRDVAAIIGEVREFRRATVGTFNALREDFSDLRTDFGNLREDFSDLRNDFGNLREEFGNIREDFSGLRTNVDRGFTEMRGKFDATAAGQQRIADLIAELIADRGDSGPPGHP